MLCRTIITILSQLDEGYGDATIVVDLDGALYKMVRNVVGTAVAAARGVSCLCLAYARLIHFV